VVASSSTGVPGTLGGAGVLVEDKDFPTLAELLHRVVTDGALREAIVAGQRERLRAFDAETIGRQLRGYLETLAT
jgi:L-malate glycosyltransferase